MSIPRALVFAQRGESWLAPRTLRALAIAAPGLAVLDRTRVPWDVIGAELRASEGPVWLVRAGTYGFAHLTPLPPASVTGRPLGALGAVATSTGAVGAAWRAILASTGGELSNLPDEAWSALPIVSAYLDAQAARVVGEAIRRGNTLGEALGASCEMRRVRVAALDASFDPSVRVVQAITSLQQGGAERVALDLHVALGKRGVEARLYTVDRPGRVCFALPPGVIDLSSARYGPEAAAQALAVEASRFGADVVHAHLLSTPTVRALASLGLPPVVTAHNSAPGWTHAFETLAAGDARLVVACALAVESDLAEVPFAPPVRTAWNGVACDDVARGAARGPAAMLRRELGLEGALVLITVANPRLQKRLDRLPAVIAALDARSDRPAHVLVVGDRQGRSASARAAEEALALEVARWGVAARVHRIDSTDAVPAWLGAADVYVSTSAYEGMSLALLEALSAGLSVVTTDVGGAREVADGNPAVRLVPEDAAPEVFAAHVLELARERPSGAAEVRSRFDVSAMAGRYERLYRDALRRPTGLGRGVWLVINNFSTGGAQSSARRLLVGLAGRGVPVRAATLQEDPERPTAGRRALEAAGVPVFAAPPPHVLPAAAAVERLLDAIDDDPPSAVLFWNALAEHKVTLADALIGVRLVDVSPGEMYYSALERYFASRRARPELPVRGPRDYGRRLHALVVKYAAEAPRAAAMLGAPVRVVPNGVPLPAATARGGDGRLVIGTAARISPQKKLEEMLAALAHAAPRLPPHVLRVAGGVEAGSEVYAAGLRAQAAGLCVEWAGELADVGPFLEGVDLFAMVSEPEGCPNASLEAMAAGLCLVVTDAGGAREQVEHGVNGLVTPRGDSLALGEALIEMADAPARRRAFGRASRQRAEERFSLTRMLDDYASLLFG